MDEKSLIAQLEKWSMFEVIPAHIQDLLRLAAAALGTAEKRATKAEAESREIERRYQVFQRWEGM